MDYLPSLSAYYSCLLLVFFCTHYFLGVTGTYLYNLTWATKMILNFSLHPPLPLSAVPRQYYTPSQKSHTLSLLPTCLIRFPAQNSNNETIRNTAIRLLPIVIEKGISSSSYLTRMRIPLNDWKPLIYLWVSYPYSKTNNETGLIEQKADGSSTPYLRQVKNAQ
jgi:hypothetical protein